MANIAKIREQAEEHLLSTMSILNSTQSYDDENLGSSKLNPGIYLSIIQALAYSVPEGGALQMGPVLADKMNILVQALQHQPPKSEQQQSENLTNVEHEQHLSYICFW